MLGNRPSYTHTPKLFGCFYISPASFSRRYQGLNLYASKFRVLSPLNPDMPLSTQPFMQAMITYTLIPYQKRLFKHSTSIFGILNCPEHPAQSPSLLISCSLKIMPDLAVFVGKQDAASGGRVPRYLRRSMWHTHTTHS